MKTDLDGIFDYLVELGEDELQFILDIQDDEEIKKFIFSLNYCGIHLYPVLDAVYGWNLAAFVSIGDHEGFIGLNKRLGLYFKKGDEIFKIISFDHAEGYCEIETLGRVIL